eukprot:488589_1
MGQKLNCASATSYESTDYSNIHPLSSELECSIINQYKKQRRFISCAQNDDIQFNTTDSSVTVMTYNILADGERYALNSRYDYCDLTHRIFDYRGPRIVLKIKAYEPDVICMQEITFKLYNEYFKPEMEKLGYIGIYGRRNNLHEDQQDDCIWIKTDKIDIVKYKVIRLGNAAGKDAQNSYGNDLICDPDEIRDLGRNAQTCYFYKQLEHCKDVFIVALCNLKSSNKQFVVCSSHLYWRSKSPHIKVGQSYLFNYRLHKLLTEIWNVKNVNDMPIIIGLDSNSLPKQSGMYTFMTSGILSKSHPEHPANHYKMLSIPNHDWKLPFDWKWKSVYNIVSHKQNKTEPCMTKCIRKFHGCIDYLFINNNFKVIEYVEMPWQSSLNFHNNSNNLNENEINNQIAIEKLFAMHFKECPNEWYPSDHLLLCARLIIINSN